MTVRWYTPLMPNPENTAMNERIKQLANQAMDHAEAIHGRFHEEHEAPNWDTFNAYEQKFAELIVQECAKVSENYAAGSMPLSIALAIKEHFGVEA
jgi:hypothetical protein